MRELKRHMGTHARLSVVCVWCPAQQKTLSRMRDLKRHANTYHPRETSEVTPAFFTEGNGYWLALWLKDYCRLSTPTDYGDEVACKARELILQWVIQVPNPTRVLHQWQSGWNHESESGAPPSKRQATMAYSPSRPSIAPQDLVLIDLGYNNRVFTAHFRTSNSGWYEARLSACMDARNSSTLMRRLIAIQGENISDGRPSNTTPLKLNGQILGLARKTVSSTLGIPEALVEEVTDWQVHTNILEESPFPVPPAVNRLPRPFPAIADTSRLLPPVPMSTLLRHPQLAIATPLVYRDSVANPTPSVTSTPRMSFAVTTPALHGTRDRHLSSDSDVEEGCQEEPRGGVRKSTSLIVAKPEDDVHQMKDRATKLLRSGGMPLFPAARREWNSDINVKFPVGNGTLSWPPEGWRELEEGQRLMAMEYAAMSLEFQKNISADITKTYLLDKYNFLMLPGTSTFPIRKQDETDHITRIKNFQSIECIAKTGKGDNRLLSMLEFAAVGRDASTDYLLEVVDKAGVPLRI